MHVGGLATRLEGADEAGVARHLGLTHVDIDLGAVHEQLGLIAGTAHQRHLIYLLLPTHIVAAKIYLFPHPANVLAKKACPRR